MELSGRLVPLDIFDYTVNHISQNLNIIQEEKCFNSIKILDRTGKVLFPNGLTPIIDIVNYPPLRFLSESRLGLN